jgi:hypothetical protein
MKKIKTFVTVWEHFRRFSSFSMENFHFSKLLIGNTHYANFSVGRQDFFNFAHEHRHFHDSGQCREYTEKLHHHKSILFNSNSKIICFFDGSGVSTGKSNITIIHMVFIPPNVFMMHSSVQFKSLGKPISFEFPEKQSTRDEAIR